MTNIILNVKQKQQLKSLFYGDITYAYIIIDSLEKAINNLYITNDSSLNDILQYIQTHPDWTKHDINFIIDSSNHDYQENLNKIYSYLYDSSQSFSLCCTNITDGVPEINLKREYKHISLDNYISTHLSIKNQSNPSHLNNTIFDYDDLPPDDMIIQNKQQPIDNSNSNNIDNSNSNNNYEFVNHPSHYNEWSYEAIDMMEKIYGTELAAWWCELTAMKYALRMGFKPTEDVMQDLNKRNWYLKKAKELRDKLK